MLVTSYERSARLVALRTCVAAASLPHYGRATSLVASAPDPPISLQRDRWATALIRTSASTELIVGR